MRRAARWLVAAWVLFGLAAGPAVARTLAVGPDAALKRPSDAAKAAQDGDTVLIAPGTYYDCAIWRANGLTIAAAGPGVVMTDTACQGKASFVIGGRGVTVRGITFARIRVADGNGAGIRAEGGDLTVEQCSFINNQVAIMTAPNPAATLRVRDSHFRDNGACEGGRCQGTLMVGRLAGLEVTESSFAAPRGGVTIASDAGATTLRGNHIADAEGRGAGLVRITVRGKVVVANNVLEQPGDRAAVALTGGGGAVEVRGNTYRGSGALVLNWSDADPAMQGNDVGPDGTALSTSGAWWALLKATAHRFYDPAHAFAGKVKGKLVELGGKGIGRLGHLLP
ncbi:MAG: hypothetical protein BGP12_05775 [Rhodospirillales bacterium 70-18]|nr:right-handed parallel beta-helix repeat-containing protein [Rhodospirillales bacterium]OJY76944.1 MAG: hypothetical protein BGP12_05775 [Rhodospirillales bacterium 70-18]